MPWYDTIKTLTIPFPRSSRNISRGSRPGEPFYRERAPSTSIRIADDEREVIQKAASEIGMTLSELMRWCALNAAVQINQAAITEDFKRKGAIGDLPAEYDPYKDGFK